VGFTPYCYNILCIHVYSKEGLKGQELDTILPFLRFACSKHRP